MNATVSMYILYILLCLVGGGVFVWIIKAIINHIDHVWKLPRDAEYREKFIAIVEAKKRVSEAKEELKRYMKRERDRDIREIVRNLE